MILRQLFYDAKLFFSLLLFSILILVLDNLGYLNSPKAVVQTITIPIQYGLYQSSKVVTKQLEFAILARRASQENKALTEQLALVISENANLRRKLAETEGFLEQKKTLDPLEFSLVGARPIGKNRFLIIDKGSQDNIKKGQAVVYKDNYLGQIQEVSSKKSLVLLSSDPDSKVSAFVNNKAGKGKGVLIGEYGSEMLLDKVLHNEPIEKDDLIYTEGTEAQIPRGLVLGRVVEVLQRDNQVFKQAKIKPVFDIDNLDILFVVTN